MSVSFFFCMPWFCVACMLDFRDMPIFCVSLYQCPFFALSICVGHLVCVFVMSLFVHFSSHFGYVFFMALCCMTFILLVCAPFFFYGLGLWSSFCMCVCARCFVLHALCISLRASMCLLVQSPYSGYLSRIVFFHIVFIYCLLFILLNVRRHLFFLKGAYVVGHFIPYSSLLFLIV